MTQDPRREELAAHDERGTRDGETVEVAPTHGPEHDTEVHPHVSKSGEPVEVSVTVPDLPDECSFVDLLTPGAPRRIEPGPKGVLGTTIDGYGFLWLRVCSAQDTRVA